MADEMPRMSKLALTRVPPVWLALTAWQMWRRLPPPVRRRIRREARKHGPQAARAVQRAVERRVRPGPKR